jgi:hypothetical protein
MMIKQYLGECWIIVWSLSRIVEIEHEWTLYMHIICIVFHVLILKVVAIYFEPSLLVIVLKNLSACVSHTSSLTYDHHGLKYMNTSMNL